MEGSECPPVIVEGDWTPAQAKALKNKLQLYFQSKKKSGGGDCRIEAEEGAPRAAVYFSSPEVRERVLARKNHEIILDSKTIQLRLSSEAVSPVLDVSRGCFSSLRASCLLLAVTALGSALWTKHL
uniref:PAR14-like first RRM domain-containing protein n=1 Tax=Maylandia zebra TaxID=106582 RepID=A0A3P9DSE2_9CICH